MGQASAVSCQREENMLLFSLAAGGVFSMQKRIVLWRLRTSVSTVGVCTDGLNIPLFTK